MTCLELARSSRMARRFAPTPPRGAMPPARPPLSPSRQSRVSLPLFHYTLIADLGMMDALLIKCRHQPAKCDTRL
jgi:hypothetical protein